MQCLPTSPPMSCYTRLLPADERLQCTPAGAVRVSSRKKLRLAVTMDGHCLETRRLRLASGGDSDLCSCLEKNPLPCFVSRGFSIYGKAGSLAKQKLCSAFEIRHQP